MISIISHQSNSARIARSAFVRTLAGLGAAALLLSACGGDAKDSSSAPKTIEDRITALTTSFLARQGEVEAEVSKCMKALGWEYNAVDYSALYDEGSFYFEQTNAPNAFKEKWGYGIATVVGREDELGLDAFSDFSDPNQKYVESLSDAEQKQYYEDRYGDEFSSGGNGQVTIEGEMVGETTTTVAKSSTNPGCQQKATKTVIGDNPLFDNSEVGQKLDDFQSEVEDDDRVKNARKDWAACMKDAGYDYKSTDDVTTYLSSQLSKLRGENIDFGTEGADPNSSAAPDYPKGADGEPDFDLYYSTSTTKVPSPDELKKLQEEELAIAKQDLACSKKYVDDVLKTVKAENEQRFADENPDVMSALEDLETSITTTPSK
jgi:hypothetical protein